LKQLLDGLLLGLGTADSLIHGETLVAELSLKVLDRGLSFGQ
jgi:hypothetical protein